MFEVQHLQETWQGIITTFSNYFWSSDTLIQAVYILSSFIIGGFIYRLFIHKRALNAIDTSNLPYQTKRTLRNIKLLSFPALVLALVFFGTQITQSLTEIDTSISTIIMKLLLAWITIRMILQFIKNSLVQNIFAFSIWTIAALSIFGILDATTTTLDAIGFNVGDFRLSALAIIEGTLALFALLYFALLGAKVAEQRIKKSKNLTRSSQVLISKIVRVTLVVFAIIIGLTSAGIDLSAFTFFSGALGLGIGFGLQKVVSNLFSGMLLLMDKSINPGDVIELDTGGASTFGWVNHMGARFTEIVTRDNKSFLIPNEEFITNRVINWSHGNALVRLQIHFGAHYESDPHKVMEIAKKAAIGAHARIVDTPEPVCWLTEFGDSSLNFSLRFWIKDAEAGVTNIKGHVMLALWDAFKEHDIKIPYPHREVFLHNR